MPTLTSRFQSLALLWAICSSLAAQTPAKFQLEPMSKPKTCLKDGYSFFNNLDYENAYPLLRKAYKHKKKSDSLYFKLGTTAMQVRDYTLAAECFGKLTRKSKFKYAPYQHAMALKCLGRYEEATQVLTAFSQKLTSTDKKNTDYFHMAERQLNACAEAQLAQDLIQRTTVNPMSTINTKDDEFCMAFSSDSTPMVFTQRTDRGSMFRIKLEKVTNAMNGGLGASSSKVEGLYIAPDGVTVYFSKIEMEANGKGYSRLYKGILNEKGVVLNFKKLNGNVNIDRFNSKNPTLAIMENGQEVLYFSSDMPGGEGGYDIWFSIKTTDGNFTKPTNIGTKNNSPFDEITPFYSNKESTLYYSSNKPESFGGFDIFKVKGMKNQWQKTIHLTIPFNSPADDYYYIITDSKKIFLTSNRKESMFQAYEYCCDDLYQTINP